MRCPLCGTQNINGLDLSALPLHRATKKCSAKREAHRARLAGMAPCRLAAFRIFVLAGIQTIEATEYYNYPDHRRGNGRVELILPRYFAPRWALLAYSQNVDRLAGKREGGKVATRNRVRAYATLADAAAMGEWR